jgi:hypothetical protein
VDKVKVIELDADGLPKPEYEADYLGFIVRGEKAIVIVKTVSNFIKELEVEEQPQRPKAQIEFLPGS